MIEKLLKIQQEQLANWKTKLNAETYNKLADFCSEENSKISINCNRVVRGDNLTIFILNL